MVENDTIRLLRECNAGVKMGISSVEEMLPKVENTKLKDLLQAHLNTSHDIMNKTYEMLASCGDDGKEPNKMAKGSHKWCCKRRTCNIVFCFIIQINSYVYTRCTNIRFYISICIESAS